MSILDDPLIRELRSAAGPVSVLRALTTHARAEDPDDGQDIVFHGHGAVFDVRSEVLGGTWYSFVELVQRGAFRKVLDEDQDTVFVLNHDGLPLARTSARSLDLSEDARGLAYEARAVPVTLARDLAMAMRAGNIRHSSFAFTIAEDLWEEHNLEDGRTEIVRTIIKVERLYDVSAVTFPAYPQTDSQVRERDVARVADRFGLKLPDDACLHGIREQLAARVGDPVQAGREARQARHRELVAGAKRRLTLGTHLRPRP